MVLVLKNVTLVSLCLFNDHLVRQCGRFWLLYKLTYLVVDGGMVQQVDHSLLFRLLLPLAPPDSLLDAEIQVSRCLRFVLSEVCQIGVSEMPKWSWLFEALLESVPYLLYYLTVLDCIFKSVPAVVCFIASCHKYEGPLPLLRDLVCHEDHFHSPLEDLPSGLPCLLLSSSSPDTSPLGTDGMISAIRWSFQDHEGETGWEISQQQVEGSNLMFGMHWGMLRQCPLVMAYRGRTDRTELIEVTMCCPERTK